MYNVHAYYICTEYVRTTVQSIILRIYLGNNNNFVTYIMVMCVCVCVYVDVGVSNPHRSLKFLRTSYLYKICRYD